MIGVNDEDTIIRWKQQFASKWISTGIPFVQDISPGYDARIVFPGPHIFGNTATWRDAASARNSTATMARQSTLPSAAAG